MRRNSRFVSILHLLILQVDFIQRKIGYEDYILQDEKLNEIYTNVGNILHHKILYFSIYINMLGNFKTRNNNHTCNYTLYVNGVYV